MEECSTRELIAFVAGPRGWNDTRQSWLARAAKLTGIGHRTIKGLFYGEFENKRATQTLRAIARQKLQVASTFESGSAADRALADQLRAQARRLGDLADRG